ncbi:hypothetical protein [Pseudomonas sp. 22 E 5]|nr:hypothetical protein [Pseudomonas sp. 22 E 5]
MRPRSSLVLRTVCGRAPSWGNWPIISSRVLKVATMPPRKVLIWSGATLRVRKR